MALSVQQQLRYWGIAAAVFLIVLWFLGGVVMPFVLGGAIAYCLDPIADWFERRGMSRALATSLASLSAIMAFVIMALAVMPLLISQARALIAVAPDVFNDLRTYLTDAFPSAMDNDSILGQSLSQVGETLQAKGGALLQSILTSALGVLNVLVLLFIVPVVAFYLLLDWDHMIEKIDDLLPREHAPVIRRLASDVNQTLAAFIRGQGMVMLIQGAFYAAALMAIGLEFGLVVGAIAGLISFIPYIGAIVGGALAIGLALFQFLGHTDTLADGTTVAVATDWFRIGGVVAIFFAGQFIEGNILTPKLVGSSVGLHPVWLLFALSVFGTLFGFVGLLVAVPVAASLGVVARFAIEQYMAGYLYTGARPNAEDVSPDESEDV